MHRLAHAPQALRHLALLALLLALAGAADAHAGDRLDKLDRQLHKLVRLGEGPPGASALVQQKGKVDFLRAGVADLEGGRPIHRNDHLRTASNGKAFSGAVALQLVDDGSLSLDSTIAAVLPDQPAAWGAVTLRQLLQHTSGVPSFPTSEAWQDFVRMNPGASVTPQFTLGFVANEPLLFPPGSTYKYSNSDNLLIGLMAEAVTGRPYAELLQELVYSPLGLKQTSLPSVVEMPRPFVHGYDIAPPAPPDDISEALNPALFWAAGGMVSTQTELNRFIRAYASGRLIERSTKLQQRSFIPGYGGEPPGPDRTRLGWRCTDTRPTAARCSGTPATSPATPSSSPRLRMAAAPPWFSRTSSLRRTPSRRSSSSCERPSGWPRARRCHAEPDRSRPDARSLPPTPMS